MSGMAECKNCGKLATKSYNLSGVVVDCECGTYTEDNMTPNPVKAVIYDRSMFEYKVVNRDDFVWPRWSNNSSNFKKKI